MNADLVTHVLELLAPLGRTRAKRMFGGHGLYVDDVFIALIAFERLYLKVDDDTRARFEAAGCQPFIYDGKGKPITMSYWTVPPDAMESPALMQPWARLAMAAALRAKSAKPPAKTPRPAAAKRKAAATPRKTPAAGKRSARKG
jgi:DNA transformation protein and related proteins